MWVTPKDNKSKHLMTMMWVAKELPNIFLSVLSSETKKIETDKPSVISKAHGYSCSLCYFKTTRSAILKSHKKTVHDQTVQCFYCDQTFPS